VSQAQFFSDLVLTELSSAVKGVIELSKLTTVFRIEDPAKG
jgi:hypothetical protein